MAGSVGWLPGRLPCPKHQPTAGLTRRRVPSPLQGAEAAKRAAAKQALLATIERELASLQVGAACVAGAHAAGGEQSAA